MRTKHKIPAKVIRVPESLYDYIMEESWKARMSVVEYLEDKELVVRGKV